MTRHLGLFSALGLAAMVGLMGSGAHAATITMTISTNGHVITETSVSSNSLTVPATINTTLAADGSLYRFSNLGASSNFPGSNGANGGSLTTSGGLFVATSGAGVTGAIVITTTESGFTAPTGAGGLLISTATSNYSNVPAGGSESYFSTFNATNSPTGSSVSSGVTANSPPMVIPPVPIGAVASGYSLANNLSFNLTQNTVSQAADGFSGTAQVTAVPEPASIVMMLTGMPLPLVVMGLIRRRRRAAA